MRRLDLGFLLPLVLVLSTPTGRAEDAASLEAQCQEDLDKADGYLKKIQDGQMKHKDALEELEKMRARVGRLEELDAKAADPIAKELNSITYWVKKMAPVFEEDELEPKRPTPGPAAEPEEKPGSDPDVERPAEPPQSEPKPEEKPPEPPEFEAPALPEGVEERAKALRTFLADPDIRVRAWAAGMVVRFPRESLVDRLFELALADPDPSVKEAAKVALCETRHSRVTVAIQKKVEKATPEELETLFQILEGRGPDRRAVALLFEIVLAKEEPLDPANARSKDEMKAYREAIKSAYGLGWRARVFTIFQNWPGGTVVAGVGSVAKDKSGRARQEALVTLGLYGDGRGAGYAVGFLTKSDNPYRSTALATVELIGKPAVPYLAGGLGSESTKLWSYQALINITEARVGARPQDWAAWWRQNR